MTKQYLLKSFDFCGDSMDVVNCFRSEPHIFLLDSSQCDTERGRYSFIGFDPFDVLIHKGPNTVTLLKEKFNGFVASKGKGYGSSRTPLTAGIVGCLGYDYGLHQENIRLRANDDLNLPDCYFGFLRLHYYDRSFEQKTHRYILRPSGKRRACTSSKSKETHKQYCGTYITLH